MKRLLLLALLLATACSGEEAAAPEDGRVRGTLDGVRLTLEVADTAEEVLPRAAVVGLTPDGRPAAGRVALALLRQPRELPALLTVAKRSRVALQSLGSARDGLRQACAA